MQKLLPLSFVALLSAASAFAPLPAPQDDPEAPSLASRVLAGYRPQRPEKEGAAARVAAARALVAALPESRRAELLLPLDDPERANWTNVPPRADEEGLRLGDCDEDGLRRACDLLATVLSDRGYARTRDILLADDRLLPNGRSRPGFGAENFWLVLFGTPDAEERWGLQLDGHHLALNLTFEGEAMTMSPTFLGAQPSSFERDGETVAPLSDVVATAFALAGSLADDQREAAVVGPTRGRNVAAAGKDGFVPDREGLACERLDDEQRALALALAAHVVRDLPDEIARPRLAELREELPRMHFAWRGPVAPGSDVSFRLQGPTLILEYACQDLGGDPLDHLHLMVRDPTNEYGARL